MNKQLAVIIGIVLGAGITYGYLEGFDYLCANYVCGEYFYSITFVLLIAFFAAGVTFNFKASEEYGVDQKYIDLVGIVLVIPLMAYLIGMIVYLIGWFEYIDIGSWMANTGWKVVAVILGLFVLYYSIFNKIGRYLVIVGLLVAILVALVNR